MSPVLEGLVLVDTSAWIGFFRNRGSPEIKDQVGKLIEDDLAAAAGPIALELIQGCRSRAERQELEERLQALHWLETEERHWYMAGRTAFSLRRTGITVSAIDALIATLAESYGCVLLHQDSDFEHIARHTALRLFAL